jgi:hypothetical protein
MREEKQDLPKGKNEGLDEFFKPGKRYFTGEGTPLENISALEGGDEEATGELNSHSEKTPANEETMLVDNPLPQQVEETEIKPAERIAKTKEETIAILRETIENARKTLEDNKKQRRALLEELMEIERMDAKEESENKF